MDPAQEAGHAGHRLKPLVIAHRGASGREVENSLAAFRLAAEMGADAVELDIHSTADGEFVVFHDDMVGSMPAGRTAFAQLRKHLIGNGEPLPTLEEALGVIQPAMFAFVEIKTLDQRWDEKLLKLFDTAPSPGRIAVHSFDHRIIRRLCAARPSLAAGVLLASYVIDAADVMLAAGARALWQRWQYVDQPLIDQIHQAKGHVYAWTADDPAAVRRLIGYGTDGICTNHPDRARREIDSPPS